MQRLGRPVVPVLASGSATYLRRVIEAAGAGLYVEGTTVHPLPTAGRPGSRVGAGTAYVLFTSGSTGAPKGVPISYRNVDAYLSHVCARYPVTLGDRVSQNFDLTFDLSVFDVFLAWSSGGTLVVPSEQERLVPARFASARNLTHWFSVPSAVTMSDRLGLLRPAALPALRWSLFCGEPLTLAQARAWKRAAPHSVVENLYGPTELTVSCTEYRLPDREADWPRTHNGTVPIGRLYPDMEGRLLTAEGSAVPVAEDAEGELMVRGPQRFGGYVDPADNGGRFRPDPVAAVRAGQDGAEGARAMAGPLPEQLWYHTGDLVRSTRHGLLHLGRNDSQVKIRGYRVELREVEHAAQSVDGVEEAVVVAPTSPAGDRYLALFYVGRRVEDAQLRQKLSDCLPAHMWPLRFVSLDAIPLNRNGKVDRRALEERLGPHPARPGVRPATPASSS